VLFDLVARHTGRGLLSSLRSRSRPSL
jgi:hypothetical protein